MRKYRIIGIDDPNGDALMVGEHFALSEAIYGYVDVITIRCPSCGRIKADMPRAEHDPPNAEVVEIHCPECDVEDKDGVLTTYYDSRGTVIEAVGEKGGDDAE